MSGEKKRSEEKSASSESEVPAELRGPKWSVLSLPALRRNAAEIAGLEAPKSRTLKAAFEEVREALRARGDDLSYACGRCNAPVGIDLPRCWACGATFDGDPEPEITLAELRDRARRLGISTRGKDADALRTEIEAAEKRRIEGRRSGDLGTLESTEIIANLTRLMPNGYRRKNNPRYTAFFEKGGRRRIGVKYRGLSVHFSVDDGFFDGEKDVHGLVYLDAEERRRRHYGRTNYVYEGDLQRVAIRLAEKVFGAYR